MYPDLEKVEQSHDKRPRDSIGPGLAVPSDSGDNAEGRLLKAAIDSVRTLKGFIADYDRVAFAGRGAQSQSSI